MPDVFRMRSTLSRMRPFTAFVVVLLLALIVGAFLLQLSLAN